MGHGDTPRCSEAMRGQRTPQAAWWRDVASLTADTGSGAPLADGRPQLRSRTQARRIRRRRHLLRAGAAAGWPPGFVGETVNDNDLEGEIERMRSALERTQRELRTRKLEAEDMLERLDSSKPFSTREYVVFEREAREFFNHFALSCFNYG